MRKYKYPEFIARFYDLIYDSVRSDTDHKAKIIEKVVF